MLRNNAIHIGGRRFRLSRRKIYFIISVITVLFLEVCLHMRNLRVTPLSKSIDIPFATHCLKPDVHAPRENATIVMLARNSEVRGAIRSIKSIEKQFNRWFNYPIVFLNDVPWDSAFIDALTPIASGDVRFEVIDSSMWGFPEWMDLREGKAAVARQTGIIYGALESYHHMCRFNSGYDIMRIQSHQLTNPGCFSTIRR